MWPHMLILPHFLLLLPLPRLLPPLQPRLLLDATAVDALLPPLLPLLLPPPPLLSLLSLLLLLRLQLPPPLMMIVFLQKIPNVFAHAPQFTYFA